MANDLAEAAGVEPKQVSSLLRWDMDKGRIQADKLDDGRIRYRLAPRKPTARDLADRWAHDVVVTEGVPLGEGHFSMADEVGREVKRLAEASDDFRDAARWLLDRDLAELDKDDDGDVILLKASA